MNDILTAGPEATTQPTTQPGRLPHLPISFFAMVMGLSGLTIAWEKAQLVFGLDLGINPWMAGMASVVFVMRSIIYAAKLVLHRQSVLGELRHPVKLNFFPTISISLVLLSIAFLPIEPAISQPLWLAGTTLHLLFTQLGRFARLKFFLSWWAYSFPLAAISIASMLMFELSGVGGYRWIGAGLLIVLTAVVTLLLVRTALAVRRHSICLPGV